MIEVTDKKDRNWKARVYRTDQGQYVIDIRGQGVEPEQIVEGITKMLVGLK